MKEYIDGLRDICASSTLEQSPYLLRTRFERNLFGLLVSVSDEIFGKRPKGLTRIHIREFLAMNDGTNKHNGHFADFANDLVSVYERFTFLSDTSNLSDDGQDPRVESCRTEILSLCEVAESFDDQAGISIKSRFLCSHRPLE